MKNIEMHRNNYIINRHDNNISLNEETQDLIAKNGYEK